MKTRITIWLLVVFLGSAIQVNAQGVSINENGSQADASAMLDIQSTSAGLLIPRMNFAEMFLVNEPATGLLVYCTTDNNFYFFNGLQWKKVVGSADEDWTVDGDDMYANNAGLIGIGTTTVLPTHKLTIENNDDSDVLRLIGPESYGASAKLNFGDGDYVYLHEYYDDKLVISATGGVGQISNGDIEVVSNFADVKVYVPEGSISMKDTPSDPDPSAVLDINSSSKGMLIPRMSGEQIGAIEGPADGLQAYNTDNGSLYIFVASSGTWKQVSYGASFIAPPFQTCGDLLTDSRDGQIYSTVEINGQCWMAENLNYGNSISTYTSQSNNSIPEKYCYGNNAAYCDNLGGLYLWDEMMDYSTTAGAQGICMDGWHVPTDAEWYAMENFLDPAINNPGATNWRGVSAGQKLKNSGAGPPYNWYYGNTGNNASGFTALPGGIRTTSGASNANPYNAAFWTSSLNGSMAYEREFYYGYSTVYRNSVSKAYGMSVRCLKD